MESVLMCKNKPIYNIETEDVYCRELLPGYMHSCPCSATFKHWFALRYSSDTNSIARHLKGISFGQGKRSKIDKETYALSLSDTYWVKESESSVQFEQVSPYYQPFWTGEGPYKAGSIPTLYVNGFLTKEWVSEKELRKYGGTVMIEKECTDICRMLGIPSVSIHKIPDETGIAIENLITPQVMLEQADQSGKIDPENFDEREILRFFGIQGLQMIVVDAILGNGDRHAGNFGWLRDTETGEYLSMAPLYDFDHALDSESAVDCMITDAAEAVLDYGGKKEAIRICQLVAVTTRVRETFRIRAHSMLMALKQA